jgi:hypothetical protein
MVTFLAHRALCVRTRMRTRGVAGAAALVMALPALVGAQQGTPAPPVSAPLTLFEPLAPQTERFKTAGEFVATWSHDGAQATLGLEKQARVGMAIFTVIGKVSPRVRYVVSVNPVNETASTPSCGKTDYFYPNNPALYTLPGPNVPCDVEDGLKRVDTYNTFALDYINQQGMLREGYLDVQMSRHLRLRAGRFILPIGLTPQETGATTAKDITRIQRINAEANFGALFAYSARRRSGQPLFDLAAGAVLGDGNREKDYDWFYFVNTSLDTNSALTAVASARLRPVRGVDLRAGYKWGYTGSKVERLPSYWASKRHDKALVFSVRLSPGAWGAVFGEYAKYTWGPTATSADMLGYGELPGIDKAGYSIGGELSAPVLNGVRVGVSGVREELSRDDSMIQYLALNRLYRVEMGRNDRQRTLRAFVDVGFGRVSLFWVDVSNPFPWVSAMWPVTGPTAYTGRRPNRIGVNFSVRTP